MSGGSFPWLQGTRSLVAQIQQLAPVLTTAEVCDLRAEHQPDDEAITDLRQRLSWADIREQSDRLAAGLHRVGLVRGDRLLVQLPNVVELFLARVACEKAGIQLVTAATTFRAAELAQILRLTRPAAAVIAAATPKVDYLQALAEAAESAGVHPLPIIRGEGVPPGALAYAEVARPPVSAGERALLARSAFTALDRIQILTTSGSTGIPKCIETASYARMLTGIVQAQRFALRPDDTVAALTPLFAGASDSLVYHTGPRLARRLVLLEQFETAAALDLLEREGVAIATLVPTILVRLAEHLSARPRRLPTLRALVTYGAKLAPDVARQVEALTGSRIVQAYGMTEFGGIAATPIGDPPELRHHTVGPPLDGNEVRVVDATGRDLPPGEVGQVWLRGLHAVGGFYRNSQLTLQGWQSGYFAVGDLGRLDASGHLALAGRQDQVIIRGGQNIYPEDIEVLLMKHPRVAEAAVVGMPDREMGERVGAFIVAKAGPAPSLQEIRAFLTSQGVARFKLPEHLECLDGLPKGPSGLKIDKQMLRARFGPPTAGDRPQ